ncbi:outer membrane beta-barrel protein [Daejeonella sp. H1SJ63]|jgi:opacity protein-like surface antigen|uniref:type IX secretion/gliding motility protein PorT/SprT n=1 Tax=Daejeonella sp. H1SJ63 TaxID=3034145 RepID=UPI0023EB4DF1|nr:outer membrane beta-barrel protein [Daejeonella sp. H1SJ63]
MKGFFLSGILCVLLTAQNSFGQENWGGGVDGEQLHFGFTFQYVASEFKILKTSKWKGTFIDPFNGLPMIDSEMKSLSSPVTPGFGLGFVSDLRLGDNANLRFTPGMVFADRIVNYEYENAIFNTQKRVQATLVDLPLGIKLKSDRQKNFRAYVIAGAKYSVDIVSKKKTDDLALSPEAKYLKNNKNTIWYEAGFGLDIYFEFFKMSPEIKFAQSAKSVLRDFDRPENPYTAPIDKLFIRNLQFSLYFE